MCEEDIQSKLHLWRTLSELFHGENRRMEKDMNTHSTFGESRINFMSCTFELNFTISSRCKMINTNSILEPTSWINNLKRTSCLSILERLFNFMSQAFGANFIDCLLKAKFVTSCLRDLERTSSLGKLERISHKNNELREFEIMSRFHNLERKNKFDKQDKRDKLHVHPFEQIFFYFMCSSKLHEFTSRSEVPYFMSCKLQAKFFTSCLTKLERNLPLHELLRGSKIELHDLAFRSKLHDFTFWSEFHQ